MRRLFLLALPLLALGACTTTQLQTEAQRLAYISQIACKADQVAQPIVVAIAQPIAVAALPGDMVAVNAAVLLDNQVHAALQAACPAGTQFLQAVAGSATPPTAAVNPT